MATSQLVFRYHDVTVFLEKFGLAILGAILAFFMEVGEYLLLVYTSSLTLSISGILKVRYFDLYDCFAFGAFHYLYYHAIVFFFDKL